VVSRLWLDLLTPKLFLELEDAIWQIAIPAHRTTTVTTSAIKGARPPSFQSLNFATSSYFSHLISCSTPRKHYHLSCSRNFTNMSMRMTGWAITKSRHLKALNPRFKVRRLPPRHHSPKDPANRYFAAGPSRRRLSEQIHRGIPKRVME
jgi:hypothetical protein